MNEDKIQNALHHHCLCKQNRFAIPNAYLYHNESDLLSVSRSGYVQEYEIKISKADFRADFKKYRHREYQNPGFDRGPAYFSYVAPEGIIEVKDLPEYAGLLHYKEGCVAGENGYVTIVKKAMRFKNSQKLSIKQCLELCGKLSFRYWDMRRRTNPLRGGGDEI